MDGGHPFCKTVRGNSVPIDNSWIVPYNLFICLKYHAHINVEVVYLVMAVKYLYKHITKGSDRVMLHLANGNQRDITNDERFVNARYISASEAFWDSTILRYSLRIHQWPNCLSTCKMNRSCSFNLVMWLLWQCKVPQLPNSPPTLH